MGEFFRDTRVIQQKDCNGVTFPKIVSPNLSFPCTLSNLVNSVKASKSWLELQLHQHGAILFRGFPVSSAFDFNEVVEAFGYTHISYIGAVILTNVVGSVFMTNESPLDKKIHFHHEMTLVLPSSLPFYNTCEGWFVFHLK
jgi:alpha-ketoglutarate-dependent taurine dioxygenase